MPLEHAILAFLDFKPMSGYDLKKHFDVSVAHFWSATQSHIYKSLDGLEKKGWVAVHVIQQEGKPNRKEFHLTPEGRTELRRWLITPLPLEPVRDEHLIQVFFSHMSSNSEIKTLFESRIQKIQERLFILQTSAQAAINENARQMNIDRARELWQFTLDYGIEYYKFELAWYERKLAVISSLPPFSPLKQ
jgi:PadR family transcriptional regulator AphA